MKNAVAVAILAAICAGLYFVPPVHQEAMHEGRAERAEVLETDDSGVRELGLLRYGSQRMKVKILSGAKRGEVFGASNEIRAQLELDKEFAAGDTAVVIVKDGDEAGREELVARDHWRLGWSGVLFAAFCAALIAFGGWIGVKSLFSFIFSCMVVWKVVIPLALHGWPASWVCFGATVLLTGVIMYLVAGWTRKGAVAALGASLGVFSALALAHLFTRLMHVNGATMPYVQTLLYSGFERLDLADVFIGATALASSGAVMDLAMDIAAGAEEILRHRPDISRGELLKSALRIGRSVVGTMTTTLLLAYSGGYLTLLMVFAAQGTSVPDFLNSTLVSAEVVKTLVGSFGLVLVAPFTALVAVFFPREKRSV